MDRYASFVAAKRGMAESLAALLSSGAMEPTQTRCPPRSDPSAHGVQPVPGVPA